MIPELSQAEKRVMRLGKRRTNAHLPYCYSTWWDRNVNPFFFFHKLFY